MTRSDAINELAAALAQAQLTIKGALRDKANPFFKSRYADLAAVWDACRAPLNTNGLSVVQLPAYADGVVTVTTLLLHSSGQFISGELSSPVKEVTPQAIGSAITYMRRFSLAAIVGVAPDDDDDAESAMGRKFVPPEKPEPDKTESAKLLDELRGHLQNSRTNDDFLAVSQKIKEAHEKGRITGKQKDSLRPLATDIFNALSAPKQASK